MALFTFAGLAVTSATTVIYGHPIPDLITLLSRIEGGMAPLALSLFGLTLATLTTNLAANVRYFEILLSFPASATFCSNSQC